MLRINLTQEQLKARLTYDPDTGVFRLRRTGKEVGSVSNEGYLRVKVRTRAYQAHRLAWLYVHGNFPDGQIDHINRVKLDNRLANLRDVPQEVNKQNAVDPQKNNSTGYLGVSRYKGRYRAFITVRKKFHYLGTYSTPEEARDVYLSAKRVMHAPAEVTC
jgi:hypothetical protein